MKRDVERICKTCIAYRQAEFRELPHGLYTPLSVLIKRWIDIFMNFVLELPKTRRGSDNIFIVVDRFSKMIYFILCHKTDDGKNIVNLFVGDVVRLHDIPKTIVNDRDVKFPIHFW